MQPMELEAEPTARTYKETEWKASHRKMLDSSILLPLSVIFLGIPKVSFTIISSRWASFVVCSLSHSPNEAKFNE